MHALPCSILNGTIFIDEVSKGDLWYFPAGFPSLYPGPGPDGMRVFVGLIGSRYVFQIDNTFLLSEWVAHTPPDVLSNNFGLPASALSTLPTGSLYIFPAELPEIVGGG